jgi:hypothetical protein
VPKAKSSLSISATDQPRSAASRAMPHPVIPPPTTSRSTLSACIRRNALARPRGEKGWATQFGSQPALPIQQRVDFVRRDAWHAHV